MAPANTTDCVSKSGITTDAVTGERYIPSSVRADGSKRKEIKVRPGYRPPEDVELYKNRAAEAWKNRGKSGVPGAVPGAESLKDNDATAAKGCSAASNKNAKRREAKKKAKATQDGANASGKDISQVENWRAGPAGGEKKQGNGSEAAAVAAAAPVDPEVEQEKKARNLKKKLKQARELNDKKNQGEALLPEQLEKVIKIQELIRQLDALGFDSNGDKKEGLEEKPEK
ncbi:putative RNA binding protein Pym [Aspergillus undulatus]|uniref:putative RNA binding protein Pym n=1 Tax=Aspergillus undulatus TaxID=1810928 RepID=UPI003CCD8A92